MASSPYDGPLHPPVDVVEGMDDLITSVIKAVAPGMDEAVAAAVTQLAAVGIILGGARLISWQLSNICKAMEQGPSKKIETSVVVSIVKPISVSLPCIGYLAASIRFLAGLDNIYHACSAQCPFYFPWLDSFMHRVLNTVEPVCGFLGNVMVTVLLASFAWTLLLAKDELFNAAVVHITEGMCKTDEEDVKRMMLPFRSLTSWLIVGFACILCSMTFGFSIQPLLAVGSVSGIFIGFASQEILTNLFSGLTTFLTHPFTVGDLVELQRDGAGLTKATVVRVQPLRTVFLTEDNRMILMPNRMVMDSIVVHHSHASQMLFVPEELAVSRQRVLETEFTVQMPSDPLAYRQHIKAVMQDVRDRLSDVQGLNSDTIKTHISKYADDRFVVRVKAMGDSTEVVTFEHMQEEFLLSCHDGRFARWAGTPQCNENS